MKDACWVFTKDACWVLTKGHGLKGGCLWQTSGSWDMSISVLHPGSLFYSQRDWAAPLKRSKWISSYNRVKQQPLYRGPCVLPLPNITEGETSLALSGLCHRPDSASWSALFRLREEQAGKYSPCSTAAIYSANSFHFVGPQLRSNEFWSNWWFECF